MTAASLLAQAAETVDAVASVAPWVSVLTGSGGALVALGFWVKTLLAEKAQMVEAHREKDAQLLAITRESIACIESSIARSDSEEGYRQRLEGILGRIETLLAELSRQN